MAIGRISGAMLKNNLERLGTDLSFETDLLYLDVANSRIGIGTSTPTTTLQADNVTISGSAIRSVAGDLDLGTDATNITIGGGSADYVLTTDGSGNLTWNSLGSLASGGGGGSGAFTGMDINLSTPSDSSLTQYGAINSWTDATKVTNSIDDLNELSRNVINNTAVIDADFTGSPLTGGAGMNVTLSISSDGNANQYVIDWGDGTSNTTTSSTTPSHVYATNTGSPFTVTVTASNTNGEGAGSSSQKARTSYVTIYTADPVVSFAAYAAASGGSPITYWDDGATVYFQNNTTNTTGATVQYTYAWGDGSSDDVVTSDSDAGGVTGTRLAHTFATSTETEVSRTVELTLDSHSTALPSAVPTDDSAVVKIYDDHTPTVGLSVTTGINESATSGLPVTFTNNTENTIGNYSTYGIQYVYTWGDGTTQTVNTGNNGSGDTGRTISHTYTLSGSDQASGTPQDYTGNLRVTSNHTGSPFISTNFTVHVEPDVRANISGTANRVSDRSGDNQYDVYDGVTYDGVNHALVTVTNTTQNADDYVYNWNDGSSNDTVTEDGSSAGSIGATLGHDFTGVSTGNKTLNFTANGTPDISAQTDTDSLVFQVNAVPSAPNGLSAESLTLQDSYQGTSPKLAHGFTDNSATNPLSAGASLTTTTARRYTSGTIDTNNVTNVYDGTAGTLTATINGADAGNRTFSTALNQTGTTGALIVSDQRDAHDTISSSTYPTGFYQTFDAKITQATGSYSAGVNDQRLEHTTTGNTNYVSVVIDNVTSTPTVDLSGATLTEGSVTYNYISGIPYYSAGSTLTLSGVQLYNWIGQTYRDTSSVFTIANGTSVGGTSDSIISTQYKSYANLEGASTYLVSSVPTANTGLNSSSKYAIGDQTITLTSSSVTASRKLQFRATNVNGNGSYAELNQVVTLVSETPSGISEFSIPVADSLGNGDFTDDGVRIKDFLSDTTDTPSFTGSTNFYTNSPYTTAGATSVSGTKEASVIFGTLKYDVTDHSTSLPAGPDRSSDTGTQYFTFAFRRKVVANFDLNITSSGVAGVWFAAPGTGIDSASGLNGWIPGTAQYAGAGVPGSDTGNGGNGVDGGASTGADVIPTGSSLSGGYTMTLGSENMSNATGSVVLVRIALTSGQSITSLSIGEAS